MIELPVSDLHPRRTRSVSHVGGLVRARGSEAWQLLLQGSEARQLPKLSRNFPLERVVGEGPASCCGAEQPVSWAVWCVHSRISS